MNLLVNALSAGIGGGLSYLSQQLTALRRIRPLWELRVLTAPRNDELFRSAIDAQFHRVNTPNVPLRVAYEQAVLPWKRADILYCPGNFCPVLPTSAPVVLVLQNANYFGKGRVLATGRTRRASARLRIETVLCRQSVTRAASVIVISEALMSEVASDGLQARSFHVIKPGRPSWPGESVAPHGRAPQRYFLSLANAHSHKRLSDLVDAWRRAFARTLQPPGLVLVGDMQGERFASLGEPLRRHIHFMGAVSDRRVVRWLLEHALAMASTSELEAFPLTPLEAGSVGCPLILSDIPSHREVAGDRAAYFRVGDIVHLSSLLRDSAEGGNSAPWEWPLAWDDHAEMLAEVLEGALS